MSLDYNSLIFEWYIHGLVVEDNRFFAGHLVLMPRLWWVTDKARVLCREWIFQFHLYCDDKFALFLPFQRLEPYDVSEKKLFRP